MSNKKAILDSQEILDKTFHIDTRGYRMSEVDIYLDAVITDYNMFNDTIAELTKTVSELTIYSMKLEKDLEALQAKLEISNEVTSEPSSNSMTNVDLLKRLSELEKKVYNSK